MNISSADLCKMSVQEVADFLLDHDKKCAVCKGVVDGKLYNLKVELSVDD